MLPEEMQRRTEPRTRPPRRERVRARLAIERGADGQLWVSRAERATPVRVRLCFPWSEPGRYVSLRDYEDEEVAFVADPRELEPASRAALEGALVEAGFVLEIEAIEAIDEEIEIRSWRVRTRQGPRSFQTRRDEWPRQMPAGGVLIRDVAGDLFYVSAPARLDRASQHLLWAFVD